MNSVYSTTTIDSDSTLSTLNTMQPWSFINQPPLHAQPTDLILVEVIEVDIDQHQQIQQQMQQQQTSLFPSHIAPIPEEEDIITTVVELPQMTVPQIPFVRASPAPIITSIYGPDPLMDAINNADYSAVNRIRKTKENVNKLDANGTYYPLTLCIDQNTEESMKIAKLLLANDADPNAVNKFGQSIFHIATRMDRGNFMEVLIKNGADYKAADPLGETPVTIAIRHGCISALKCLLALDDIDVNDPLNRNEVTPLMMASGMGQYDIVQLLLEFGADLRPRDIEKRNAFDYAARNSKDLPAATNTVKSLFKHALLTTTDTKKIKSFLRGPNMTTFHCACSAGNVELVHYLLVDVMVNMNIRDKNGRTGLNCAEDNGHYDVCDLLWGWADEYDDVYHQCKASRFDRYL